MTAPADQTILFNMPRKDSTTRENGWATTVFKPTPPMASYLVAFIVGNLTGVSQNVPTLDGVGEERPVSIYGIPERFLPPSAPPSLGAQFKRSGGAFFPPLCHSDAFNLWLLQPASSSSSCSSEYSQSVVSAANLGQASLLKVVTAGSYSFQILHCIEAKYPCSRGQGK